MSQSIAEVLSHHMTCLARSDVDGIVEDYTDESVLFSPDGPLVGREAVRGFYTTLIGEMMPAGTHFTPVRQDIRDDTVFLMWQADAPSMRFHLGVETLVFRDGKIAIHSFAAAIQRKE